MSYDGRTLMRAKARFDEDKERRSAQQRRFRRELTDRYPRLGEIETALRASMSGVIAAALRHGQDPAEEVARLREVNLALQEERRQLLRQAGCAPDAWEETPACRRCGDTGYDGTKLCACLKAYYVAEQNRELSKLLNIGAQSFETFRLDYYDKAVWPDYGMSPYENMTLIRETCWRYAKNFGKGTGGNLFLTGAPGLGKTFLSACIAREVSQSGFSVVYDTAGHVFSQFEMHKFRRGDETEQEEAAADVRRCLNCDLLILDDLGAELVTPLVQEVLYELINGRIVGEKRTIINSNLTEQEVRRRYSPQIASRLAGEYRTQMFFGDDIRKRVRS